MFKLFNFPRKTKKRRNSPDLKVEDNELINQILENRWSMVSHAGLVATAKAVHYVIDNNIGGDFVECGVWRGGNAILAKSIIERKASQKKVWLYDTFEGMTEPGERDVHRTTGEGALNQYIKTKTNNGSEWCYSDIEEVKHNFSQANLTSRGLHFVKGDVAKTLAEQLNLPTSISVLRLDTDWYESTLAELNALYPIVSVGGVVLLDDYGTWEGQKVAVDEYWKSLEFKPMLSVTDHGRRSAIKL